MGKNINEKFRMNLDRNQLEQGLQRLGIRELEERLEVSPLVFGGQDTGSFQPDQGAFHCGSYKEDPIYPIDDENFPPIWVK